MSVQGWADVRAGQEIPPLVKHVTMQQVEKWREVSGDNNPIHYDGDFAARCGLPGVVVHGQLITAFLCQMLSHWHGTAGRLRRLEVAYKGFNFPGDTLTCCGLVKEALLSESRVVLAIWVENQQGEKTVCGSAEVQFAPS
ncbi:MAG: dehydratase [Dehalococcoidia bacterium]|nr:dehydratase [Dehalococcoidia bacterium]